MEPINVVDKVSSVPTFEPAYVNLDYVFYQIFSFIRGFVAFIAGLLGIRINEGSTLYRMLNSGRGGESAIDLGQRWLSVYKLIVSIIAVLAIAVIIYCLVRLWEIKKEQKEKEKLNEVRVIEEESYGHTLQWQNVLDHANSDSPSDWRLAILEADTMLESASQRLPVIADTLGERLKKIDKSDLRTLDNAWEAHKVRNRIAHDGFDFEITKHETLRVINLFESVLRELGAIQN
jgi:flagellar basal body-associated protein FliL